MQNREQGGGTLQVFVNRAIAIRRQGAAQPRDRNPGRKSRAWMQPAVASIEAYT
jgi:hypothetical protein